MLLWTSLLVSRILMSLWIFSIYTTIVWEEPSAYVQRLLLRTDRGKLLDLQPYLIILFPLSFPYEWPILFCRRGHSLEPEQVSLCQGELESTFVKDFFNSFEEAKGRGQWRHRHIQPCSYPFAAISSSQLKNYLLLLGPEKERRRRVRAYGRTLLQLLDGFIMSSLMMNLKFYPQYLFMSLLVVMSTKSYK